MHIGSVMTDNVPPLFVCALSFEGKDLHHLV
jgi:hypothetical protein